MINPCVKCFFLAAFITPIFGCASVEFNATINQKIQEINKGTLKRHVEALTINGPRSLNNPNATAQAIDYIKSQLSQLGYQIKLELVRDVKITNKNTSEFINIIAEHPGTSTPESILELAAHYDSVDNSPGADDNASGVAALLEIAKVIAPVKTHKTIRLCFFTLEENGKDGSFYHVQRIKNNQENLEGVFVLEMIGYATNEPATQKSPVKIPLLFWPPSQGDFITVVGNFSSARLGSRFESAAAEYTPTLPYYSINRLGGLFKDALRSDHQAYWDSGYKAIMLTDTANFRNPHYHQASDLPDTLNYDFLKLISQAVAATALQWSLE